MIMNFVLDGGATQVYRRVGDITLSFINLFDAPYPLEEDGAQLFDAMETLVDTRQDEWAALCSEAWVTAATPNPTSPARARSARSACRDIAAPPWR